MLRKELLRFLAMRIAKTAQMLFDFSICFEKRNPYLTARVVM